MNKQHTFFIKNPSSHQDWTTDPGLIRVTIDGQLLQAAKKAADFMAEQALASCHILYGIDFETYVECDDGDVAAVFHEGVGYVAKKPEYLLSVGGIRVSCAGTIDGFVDFETTGDALRFPICEVGDLADVGDKWKRFGVDCVILNPLNQINSVLFYNSLDGASDAQLEDLFIKHKVVVHQQFASLPIWVIACQIIDLAKRGAEAERTN